MRDISESGMARAKHDHEVWPQRFPPGTKDRIDAVLVKPETRADFVRQAVEREIKRRSRTKPPSAQPAPP